MKPKLIISFDLLVKNYIFRNFHILTTKKKKIVLVIKQSTKKWTEANVRDGKKAVS